jgi:hypothetical protein
MPETGLAWGPFWVAIVFEVCAAGCAAVAVLSVVRKSLPTGIRAIRGSLAALGALLCGWMGIVYFVLAQCLPMKSCP